MTWEKGEEALEKLVGSGKWGNAGNTVHMHKNFYKVKKSKKLAQLTSEVNIINSIFHLFFLALCLVTDSIMIVWGKKSGIKGPS